MAGIIARLPGNVPLQTITPLTDSLLASPIQAVEVVYHEPTTLEFIRDLAQRGQGDLVIGVSTVDTAVSVTSIFAAGADYITSPFDNELQKKCLAESTPYIPGIISVLAAQAVFQKGFNKMQLRTGGPTGPDFVSAIRDVIPGVALLVDGDITEDNIADYAQAGATAVIVGTSIFEHPDQSMANIITRARILQKAWQNSPTQN